MKKATIFCSIIFLLVSLMNCADSLTGVDNNIQIEEQTEVVTQGVRFKADINTLIEAFYKRGDIDWKTFISYKLSLVDRVRITLQNDGRYFDEVFPVINGVVEGEMNVLEGTYSYQIVLSRPFHGGGSISMFYSAPDSVTVQANAVTDLGYVTVYQEECIDIELELSNLQGTYLENTVYQTKSQTYGFFPQEATFKNGKMTMKAHVDNFNFNETIRIVIGEYVESFNMNIMSMVENDTVNAVCIASGAVKFKIIPENLKMPQIMGSTPVDGATNVTTNTEVKIVWNKKFTYNWKNYQPLLTTTDGDTLPVDVDIDKNDPKRETIIVKLWNTQLDPGKTYTVDFSKTTDMFGNGLLVGKTKITFSTVPQPVL